MSKREWFIVALMCLVMYMTVAGIRFRFANPCMTETQLMLNMLSALAWETTSGANCKNEAKEKK